MIDRETVDRIYAAANIVDIVGDFVTLKRKGVNYQACCPFHNEKTPSFVVSPSKGVYKCFGCGKGGNAVTFLMEHENVTYPEALKMVAKRYGIEVKEKELTPEEERRNNDRESMFALNGWAADYFADYLHHESEGMSVGMAYFRQTRGMTDATIQKFGLGFCPAKGDKMSKDALAAGYKEEFLLSTGLSLKRESDGSLFDRFHDRVMFPVHNISGRIVAFGGRTLRTDKKVAKYQNSPESEIYSKKRELYGLYFAKKAIQQQDFAIMVEGYTDVISMHQAGVENVVASSGTSLTTEQIRLLNRFTKNITVIYDGDSAGIHASLRGIDMILKEGMNVRVVLLPEPEDPDSFARSHTAAELQEYIRTNEQDFLAFKAKLLLEDAQGDPIKKASLIGDMVQSVAQIPDSIQRAVYIKECARIMEIDEQILISEVARKRLSTTGDRETDEFVRRQTTLRRETPRESEVEYVREVEAGSSTDALERELCKYLLKYGHCSFDFKEGRTMVACNVAEVIFDELADGGLTFRNPQYDKIRAAYCEQWQQSGVGVEVPAHLFTNHSDPEVCNVSVDLLFSDDNYVPSELWKRKDVHVESDAEMLAVGVPKAVALYKTKVIEGLIKECQAKLGDELTDEQVTEIMQRLAALNRAKVTMARKLQRLIL
ncbi:DNA primase [uncultured Alistipes sp.]|jgi:DNA primase|uniref:DNA primase n=1 Tax=uncultured Alistipes sp. TaxID=538949 RepID=UPI0025B0C19C|nr:DNA primase [uncultured Alistipes sp.]